MAGLSFDPCGCPAHHDSHRPDCPTRRPIEPTEIIPISQVLPLIEPTAGPDADTSWIENAGFKVTRPSPPVGSVAAGFPGIGFDLMVPDAETGRLRLAEAYGPDGQRVAQSRLTGQKAPMPVSEGDRSQGKPTEEVSDERALDDELFGGLGIVHDRSLD